eukprot:8656219-Alexandrium_andersonii.AAC.1
MEWGRTEMGTQPHRNQTTPKRGNPCAACTQPRVCEYPARDVRTPCIGAKTAGEAHGTRHQHRQRTR